MPPTDDRLIRNISRAYNKNEIRPRTFVVGNLVSKAAGSKRVKRLKTRPKVGRTLCYLRDL